MSNVAKRLLKAWSLLMFGYGIYVLPVLLERGGGECLVDGRRDAYHTDYLWGVVGFVKWKHTVFCEIPPPELLMGSQRYHILGHPKPIPLPDQWQFSRTIVQTQFWEVRLHYLAYTHSSMYHTRIGWRWDDVDDFYLFSIVPVKKIPYNWERILWLREFRAMHRDNC